MPRNHTSLVDLRDPAPCCNVHSAWPTGIIKKACKSAHEYSLKEEFGQLAADSCAFGNIRVGNIRV